MMKWKLAIVLGAAILGVNAAELLTELTPAAPEAYGKCGLFKKNNVAVEKDGLGFNGKDSFLHLKTPEIPGSLTVAFQVKLDGLPEKTEVFAARRGYNNAIGCDREGRVFFDIWGENKKEHIIVRSQQRLEPGKWYDIVGVVNRESPELRLQLYINGAAEGEAPLGCPPLRYDPELIFGGANPYGQWNQPFRGKLNRIRIYRGVPSSEELKKLGQAAAETAAVAADGSVSVADFGAQPGDGEDDTAAIRKALQFAMKNGAKRLVFPKGIYDFAEAPGSIWSPGHWVFWLDKAENLEIDGGGSLFLLQGTQCFAYSKNCRNVTFRNMTLNYDRPYFSAGTVTEVSPDKYVFDVKIDPGFQVKGGEGIPSWEEVDKDFLRVNGGMFVNYRVAKTRLVEPDVLRVYASDAMVPLKKGMRLLLRHHTYTGSLFRLHESSGHVLENVTILSGKGMGVVGQYLDGLVLKNVRIVPDPNRPWPLSVASDAINLLGCYGEIRVENCEIKGSKDDNINIFSNYYGVKKQLAPDRILMNSPKFRSGEMSADRPGDVMCFVRKDFSVYAERTIKSIRHDYAQRHSEVEFTEPLPKELNAADDLLMAKKQPEKIVIRNNRFHSEGRVVLQCGNALVENNDFLNSNGFHLNTNITPWYEARPGKNVVVRNNRFRNGEICGLRKLPAVIVVSAEGITPGAKSLASRGTLVLQPVHENVEISGNVIEGSNNGGMIFASVKNLVVKNNQIKDTSRDTHVKPWQLKVRTWNENAVTFAGGIENAVFEGNRFTDSADPAKPGIIAVGLTVPEQAIRFRDNTGFKIERKELFPEEKQQ